MLIKDGTLLTLNDDCEIVTADIRISEGVIEAIAPQLERQGDEEVLDASNCLVAPGMISATTNLCDSLMAYLPRAGSGESLWSARMAHDGETLRATAEIGLHSMLKQGVTSVLDEGWPGDIEPLFTAALDAGIRFSGGVLLGDIWKGDGPSPWAEWDVNERLAAIDVLVGEWHRAGDGRIGWLVSLASPTLCSDELLQEAAAFAFDRDLSLYCPTSVTSGEVDEIVSRCGVTPVDFLMEMGFLGSQTILSGCQQLRGEEPNFLWGTGTHVVDVGPHEREVMSNESDRAALIETGINVALGGAGLRGALELSEARKRLSLSAEETLRRCVSGGAQAMGLDDSLGVLEKGWTADVIVVERAVVAEPTDESSPHAELINQLERFGPRDVMVGGIWRKLGGSMLAPKPALSYSEIAATLSNRLDVD